MNRHGWTVLPLLLIALVGCGEDKAPPEPGAPEVQVSVPLSDTITNYEVFTGRTQALNAVDLRCRVTGFLAEAPFKQGEDVKKGDVLFVIQQKPFEESLRQARATRDQQRATLLLNESLYKRHLALRNQNAMSQEDFQQTQAARDTSRAALEAAEAATAIAAQNLDWCVVRAPFDGRISRRLVDPGNDVIADNTILASLVEVDKLYAYFDVDERTLLQINHLLPRGKVPANAARTLPLMLGLANESPEQFSHQGVLDILDNKVDVNSGTLRMWGIFENSEYDLKPGMFIRVRMGIGEPRQALFVAESALGSDQGRKFLYVVDGDNHIVYKPVTVGQRKQGLIAIENGLKGDERVVINGIQRVRPNMEVIPETVTMPRVKGAGAVPVVGMKTSLAK
jgi:RND family efflux transporter MFP subunit